VDLSTQGYDRIDVHDVLPWVTWTGWCSTRMTVCSCAAWLQASI